MPRQSSFLVETLTAIGLIAAPFVLPHLGFAPTTMSRIMVWGLFGIGFDVLFGYTGLLSFGQSAFFGTGGMVAAYLLTELDFPHVLVSVIIGTIAAAIVGFLVGLIALRRTGIYFAMITVAIAEVFYFVEFNPLSDYTGGENGLPGVPTPTLPLGFTTIKFDTDWKMYAFLAFWYFVGIVIALRIVRSPVGAVLSAIRDNPLRAAAVGHNIHGYKLTAFVIAAAYAGFAGGLLGVMQGFMPPDAFTFDTSGQLVMQTAIGGAGTLFGPLVGATVWLYLSDFFQNTLHLGATWKLVLGLVFVLLVCFLRRGLVGGIVDLFGFLARSTAQRAPPAQDGVAERGYGQRADIAPQRPQDGAGRRDHGPAATADRRLRPDPAGDRPDQALWRPPCQLRHRFRGDARRAARHDRAERRRQVDILQDADLRSRADVRHDRVRRPRHHRHERDRRLPARPDQELSGQPAVHPAHGARECDDRGACRIAREIPARPHAPARARSRGSTSRSSTLLALVDLTGRADVAVAALAYGEKRRLEVGLALASSPTLLLLDEPLAGMSPLERIEMVKLLKSIGSGRTMIIIDHDMDALFELVERVTVLQEGRVLVEGTPQDIKNNAAVQEAYLGGVQQE